MVIWTKWMGNYWRMNKKQKMKVNIFSMTLFQHSLICASDWEEAFINLRETLNLPSDTQAPKIPRPNVDVVPSITDSANPPPPSSKRKAQTEDVDMDSGGDDSKKAKTELEKTTATAVSQPSADADASRIHAQAAAAYIPFLDVEHLLPPKLPSHSEMEGVLLALRKKALVEEYFGDAT
jgi:pre-mRNA-splicing factor ISY1